MKKQIQADYKGRINRVFEFIDKNLEQNLSLNMLSKIAFFSPFHFHRVFKFVTGETLNEYVTRLRIEKSALDLLHKNITLTHIAHKYGFGDNSSYSKAFKKYFGVSPTQFKKENSNKYSKIQQLNSKNGQEYPNYTKYISVINNLKNWIKMNATIEIKEMPKMDLAFVSSIGIQNIESAYQSLIQWAAPKGLLNNETKMITIYHNSFKVTAPNKVRMSASILLNTTIKTEGEIGQTSIEAGKCIIGSFVIGLNEFEKSWTGLFMWMNEKGYKKTEKEPFEIYHNNFNNHPEKKAIVDFCIPIE